MTDWTVLTGRWQDVLPADLRVDHVITDPPFEAQAHTKQRRVKRSPKTGPGVRGAEEDGVQDNPLSFEPLSFEQKTEAGEMIARVTRRWAIVFCQVEAAVPWAESLVPLRYMRTAVWVKPDGMPQYSGDRPGMGYESIVCTHAKGKSRWNGGGRTGVFVHNKNSGGKHLHETQKPLPLMLELVSLFTDPGDTILDPYCGSGTTGVACLRLGRNFIGVEEKPAYAEIARERLRAEQDGSTLEARRSGQLPMFGGER